MLQRELSTASHDLKSGEFRCSLYFCFVNTVPLVPITSRKLLDKYPHLHFTLGHKDNTHTNDQRLKHAWNTITSSDAIIENLYVPNKYR